MKRLDLIPGRLGIWLTPGRIDVALLACVVTLSRHGIAIGPGGFAPVWLVVGRLP